MKVKCITNKALITLEHKGHLSQKEEEFHLRISKEYVVYGLGMLEGLIQYLLADDAYTFYPRWHPYSLFEVTDSRLSRFWVVGLEEERNRIQPLLSFPEWVCDRYFYGELVEGEWNDPNAVIFRQYKERMDVEFPDPTITANAEIGDEEWLICQTCMDAWSSPSDLDALVKCPKCNNFYNNPRYKNEWPHL